MRAASCSTLSASGAVAPGPSPVPRERSPRSDCTIVSNTKGELRKVPMAPGRVERKSTRQRNWCLALGPLNARGAWGSNVAEVRRMRSAVG